MLEKSLSFLFVLTFCSFAHGINWQNGNWATQCDFPGNDLTNQKTSGDQCSNRCRQTPGCTHFSWNNHQGGTCWMKKGGARREQAVPKSDPTCVCGIISAGGSGGNGGNNPDLGLGSNKGETLGIPLKKGSLAWADEFDNIETFNKNWFFSVNGNGGGNNEKQFYTNRNAYLRDSLLTIEAKREDYSGKRYTSSRLKTHKMFHYGVFELKAKLPRGRGTWPAFWLLAKGTWPRDGEIDILEHVGHDMGRVHSNIHTEKYNHKKGTNIGKSTMVNNVDTEFHLYQLEWRPDRISAFVDGKEYFTYRKTERSYEAWPFDNPHAAILNVAIGGDWGGQKGIDDSIFPARFVIDYVRVYNLA